MLAKQRGEVLLVTCYLLLACCLLVACELDVSGDGCSHIHADISFLIAVRKGVRILGPRQAMIFSCIQICKNMQRKNVILDI